MPGQPLVEPLSIVVLDETGDILAIGPGVIGADSGVTGVPGRPDELIVSWLGGMCDHQVTLTFDEAEGRYAFTQQVERATGCRLAGVNRSIRVKLALPIPPEIVAFNTPRD